jgi:hypothetical protein
VRRLPSCEVEDTFSRINQAYLQCLNMTASPSAQLSISETTSPASAWPQGLFALQDR